MDEQIPSDVNESQPQPHVPVNEDAKQFSQWMAEYGRPALIGLAVAVVVLLGVSIWRNQKEAKAAAAVQALFENRSPEELQQLAVAKPDASTAPMALASAAAEFYTQNRYDEARTAYERFLNLYPTNLFAPDAAIGLAASQEALEDFEAAAAGYESFAAANAGSPLRPQAVFGAARCRQQLGQFDAARALYEDFIAANPESTWLPQAESGLLFLKKAERAKNLPAPVAPAAAAAAPVAPEDVSANQVVSEAVPIVAATAPAAAEEPVQAAAETPAPVQEEVAAAADEQAVPAGEQKKKSSSKQKKSKKTPKPAAE